jgi:hypothetical protein
MTIQHEIDQAREHLAIGLGELKRAVRDKADVRRKARRTLTRGREQAGELVTRGKEGAIELYGRTTDVARRRPVLFGSIVGGMVALAALGIVLYRRNRARRDRDEARAAGETATARPS